MNKIEKRCVGSHIHDYDDLEDLIFFITRYFNHKHIRYHAVYCKKYEYYDLYFWLTNEQYNSVCKAYRRITE